MTEGIAGYTYGNLLLFGGTLANYVDRNDDKEEAACNIITVKGMNCNHCKSNVEAAIQKIAGVESVQIDLASGRTIVHGNPNKEDVVKGVEALGFSVVESES